VARLGNGVDSVVALCNALGIDATLKPIQKVVIEAEVGSVTRVYIRGLVRQEELTQVAGLLKTLAVDDVRVTDRADVIVEVR
jgi:hypothetical protein